MAALSTHVATESDAGAMCGVCQTAIVGGEEVGPCPSCESPFHHECWTENGGCSQYGCALVPQTVKQDEAAVPRTQWGEEDKTCPVCSRTIKIAALRCKHCGEVFKTEAKQTELEHLESRDLDAARERVGNGAMVLFFAGLFPCTAPLALLAGSIWFFSNRAVIRKLPSTRRVMAFIGLPMSFIITSVLVLVMILRMLEAP